MISPFHGISRHILEDGYEGTPSPPGSSGNGQQERIQSLSVSDRDKNESGEDKLKVPSMSSNLDPSNRLVVNGSSITEGNNKISSIGPQGNGPFVSNGSGRNSDRQPGADSRNGSHGSKGDIVAIESRLEKLESAMETF